MDMLRAICLAVVVSASSFAAADEPKGDRPNAIAELARKFMRPTATKEEKARAFNDIFDWFVDKRKGEAEDFRKIPKEERKQFIQELWRMSLEKGSTGRPGITGKFRHYPELAEWLTQLVGDEAKFVAPTLNERLRAYFVGGDLEVHGNAAEPALRALLNLGPDAGAETRKTFGMAVRFAPKPGLNQSALSPAVLAEIRSALKPPQPGGPGKSDAFPVNSVWMGNVGVVQHTLTILERDGKTFKGRFEIGRDIVREVTGSVEDGKVSWLGKEVRAVKGRGQGGDNFGVIDGRSIQFTWRNPGSTKDGGQYILRRVK